MHNVPVTLISYSLCSAVLEQFGPFDCVEMYGSEIRGEFLISEARLVIFAHEIYIRFSFYIAPIGPEPFAAKRRHRVYAPMDENSDFGAVIPLRQRSTVQTIPCWLIRLCTGGALEHENFVFLAQNTCK